MSAASHLGGSAASLSLRGSDLATEAEPEPQAMAATSPLSSPFHSQLGNPGSLVIDTEAYPCVVPWRFFN